MVMEECSSKRFLVRQPDYTIRPALAGKSLTLTHRFNPSNYFFPLGNIVFSLSSNPGFVAVVPATGLPGAGEDVEAGAGAAF